MINRFCASVFYMVEEFDVMLVGNLTFRNVLAKAITIDPLEDCIFNFNNTYQYDPFAMLFMSSLLREYIKKYQDIKFVLQYDPSSRNISYAGHMGFFRSIADNLTIGKKPGEAMGSKNYLPITKIDFRNDFYREKNIEEAIEKKAVELSKILTQDKELYKIFAYIIREILRNSLEHSKEQCVWICAQHWPYYHMTEIAILDNGIGIRRSLSSNYLYASKIESDEIALQLSLLPGITEKYGKIQYDDEWNNTGYGLYMASQLCDRLNGTFSIVSDSKALFIHDGEREFIETNHTGTAIRMTLKTDQKFNYDNIRNQILIEGEQIASKIDKAIKKSSKASSGLIKYVK